MFTRRNLLALAVVLFASSVASAAGEMKFEIYSDAKGEFRWRLLNGEGTNVANSGQGYGKKADCKTMVENFKSDISKYTFEVYEDNAKDQRFRMKAKNGNTVGASTNSFKTKGEVEKLIKAIEKGAKDAKIEEVKDEKKAEKKEEKK